eukprot:gnl/Spiro4/4581_TR2283_c0_g1_i1.p1 gnl/Spiro4/4581_TR2283_c0_g1~~gnl/Spiro4/4581_TR2283_c0_g1_i1.p1  ORF type:complete len:323 (+),score=91.22 gnl/Spiro4/4581_TR2283_c0_g1_i1:136-1104(+)
MLRGVRAVFSTGFLLASRKVSRFTVTDAEATTKAYKDRVVELGRELFQGPVEEEQHLVRMKCKEVAIMPGAVERTVMWGFFFPLYALPDLAYGTRVVRLNHEITAQQIRLVSGSDFRLPGKWQKLAEIEPVPLQDGLDQAAILRCDLIQLDKNPIPLCGLTRYNSTIKKLPLVSNRTERAHFAKQEKAEAKALRAEEKEPEVTLNIQIGNADLYRKLLDAQKYLLKPPYTVKLTVLVVEEHYATNPDRFLMVRELLDRCTDLLSDVAVVQMKMDQHFYRILEPKPPAFVLEGEEEARKLRREMSKRVKLREKIRKRWPDRSR